MPSPLTDRSFAPYAAPDDVRTVGPLPEHVVRAVVEIAGTAGAWCPALSSDGARVAHVTDRSGIPRLEVAAVDGTASPVVLSGADQEVVSVAWSPDGGWLTHLVSPGGSICTEPHVVRPTIVDREHVVELSAAVVAWFDRWL